MDGRAQKCAACYRALPSRPSEERFWEKVEKTDSGCWLWRGAPTGSGYGTSTLDDKRESYKFVVEHRYAYELIVGPIPDGLVLDHLCRNRNCVNPEHLDPVPQRENALRGLKGRLLTHCAHGHPLTPENVYVQQTGERRGRRRCKVCHNERRVRYAEAA